MGAIFDSIQAALAYLLDVFYQVIPNFGLGIVILTVVVNLLLFPLTLKQTRATRAFQAIQPEIRRIQKEYKDRPEEMQKELMRVQKEAGASPGGCLVPLLVQMPIWFALFRVLAQVQVTEEILPRIARFIPDVNVGDTVAGLLRWLPDGSALGQAVAAGNTDFLGMHLSWSPAQAFAEGIATALPYLLMIVLMVATQYIQTWHSTYGQAKPEGPQAGAQQAMTKIMPLFLGFISWNFPAGLVLYWATGNLFRLGQQIVIFKIDGRPTPAATNGEGSASAKVTEPGDENRKKPQPSSKKKSRRRRS
jgi:YidC/Oxa1 family membrane protein insertase